MSKINFIKLNETVYGGYYNYNITGLSSPHLKLLS